MLRIKSILVLLAIVSICLLSVSYTRRAPSIYATQDLEAPSTVNHKSGKEGTVLKLEKRQSNEGLRRVKPVILDDEEVNFSYSKKLRQWIFGETQMEQRLQEVVENQKRQGKQTVRQKILKQSTVNLYNNYNLAYILSLYMGSASTQVDVIFDTGSDWLVVASKSCSCTSGRSFDQTASSSYQILADSSTNLKYGSANLYAFKSSDKVYLDQVQTQGISSFQFMLVSSGTGIDPFSGIIGFGRNYPLNGQAAGSLYYQYLASNSVIPSKMFSLYLGDTSEQSVAIIGGSDLNTYSSDPTQAVILTVDSDFFWKDQVDAFAVGSYSSYTSSSKKIVFDSGTSLAYLPSSVADTIIKNILTGVTYNYYSGIYYIDCNAQSSMMSLFLNMESHWFEVPASTYVIHLADSYGEYCILGFLTNTDDYYLVGDVFLRNYYTIYDDTNSQLTISPKKAGAVSSIPRQSVDQTPTTTGPPGIRNITNVYATTLSTPYIALYSVLGSLGAEGAVIGALFGFGVLTLKAIRGGKNEDEEKKKKEKKNLNVEFQGETNFDNFTQQLVSSLNGGRSSSFENNDIVIVKLQ